MNKFSPFILSLVLTALLAACGPGKDRARFEGKLANITDAEFYAYSEDGSFDGVDTIRIKDGEFTYERKLTAPTLVTLLYPNYTQTYVVLEPGKTVKLQGDAAKISTAQVSGTDDNELLSDFRAENADKPERKATLAAQSFVRDHPATLAAVAVFRKYFANVEKPDAATSLALLDALKRAQPKSRAVAYIDNFYRPIFANGVGSVLPQFTAETLDGRKVSNLDYHGKPLAILCVGTWQGESFPFLREALSRLRGSSTPWSVLIVSLDVDRSVLRDRFGTDTLGVPVVCDRQAFRSPLVSKLGLHYVPSCMLVDARGRILQRDVTKASDLKL